MKKVVLKLTPKQVDAVLTALFEWSEVEGYSVTGKRIAAHMRQTVLSIKKQLKN